MHVSALALAALALWTSLLGHSALAQTAVPLPLAAPTAPAPASAKPALPGPSGKRVQPRTAKASVPASAPLSPYKPAIVPPKLPAPSRITQDFYNSYLSGNMELAVLLLQQGADINCRNCGEDAPLLAHALGRSLNRHAGVADHVTWLLSRGADPNVEDKDGRTALYNYIAGLSQWGGGLYQIGQVSDQQLLAWLRAYLQAGGRPAQGTANGKTPLHVVASMIQVIDAGNSKMARRYQALIDELLTHGADINARTLDKGYTPLMAGLASLGIGMSSSACSHEMVSYFLSRGADRTVVGKDGRTAYDIAFASATGGNKACNPTLGVLMGPAPATAQALPAGAPRLPDVQAPPSQGVGAGNFAGQWQGVLNVRSPSMMVVPVTGTVEAGGAVALKAPAGVTTVGVVHRREGDNLVLRLRTRAPPRARFADGSVETAEFLVTGQLTGGIFRGDYSAPTDAGEFVLCDREAYASQSACRPTVLDALGGALGAILGAGRALSGN